MPGTWSATLEWLVARLAPRFPRIVFAEVRYRVKSWKRLDWCEEDARAAIAAVGALRTLLVGFSMGGAVAVRSADARASKACSASRRGSRTGSTSRGCADGGSTFCTGSSTGGFPESPASAPTSSRRGFERARSLGVEGSYRIIPGAVHGIAVRAGGGVVPLPRARRWAALAGERIETWAAAA